MDYRDILTNIGIKFNALFKTLPTKGNLVYEYNPFRNYRLDKNMLEYNGSLYTLEELKEKYEITCKIDNKEIKNLLDILDSTGNIVFMLNEKDMETSDFPILRRKGELVDFETNELKFDINHPVDIVPQYSYDGSVNLIINDGKNLPRLINSRFSATDRNKYLVVNRKGDNDTNIYDLGSEFDIDTSLIKKTKSIPNLKYHGTFSSGNLSVGNYHFYFKYLDADGNESDFFTESGLVSVFIGETPFNIHTGVRNENSHKGVSFLLSNLDSGYLYISVYYTKATSDIYENSTVSAYKIELKYLINTSNICNIKVTGYEVTTEIPLEAINLLYLIFSNVNTLTFCQNRLFFGNISLLEINYQELSDISLRFIPYYDNSELYDIDQKISEEYDPKLDYDKSYYNSKYIYDKVGYWPGEVYRFGIVYVLNDGSLTPVFNVRGVGELNSINEISSNDYTTSIPFKEIVDGKVCRKYISYNEETYLITSDDGSVNIRLENSKGVVRFPEKDDSKVYGISFRLESKSKNNESLVDDIINELLNLGIRGYFFVRQKRIPTILCLALTIGIDKLSHTPLIPYSEGTDTKYISELFLSKESPKLTHDYSQRLYTINSNLVDKGAICPEYDVDTPYYNSLFSGDSYPIGIVKNVNLKRLSYNDRFYYEDRTNKTYLSSIIRVTANILGVEDNLKLAAIDDTLFSARAGEAEEVFRFEYAETENKTTDATNLIRGSFGPFLGLKGNWSFNSSIINIYIPGYRISSMQDYYYIRYNDKSSYYAIGDRTSLENIKSSQTYYRGDCYICLFTHRVNRNFLDPSAPTNDIIVDPKCWEENWKISDGVIDFENIDKINLGDVNAIKLGLWITFVVRSTKNLNIRTIDSSNVDEVALTGLNRGFYPYYAASTKGAYKIPEALCYNKGFEKSVSERWNYEVPDVPAIKNDFTNRISYSNIHITDAFLNNTRVFLGLQYRDYPKTYGSITKIIELRGNLLCIFEHGIGLIAVNERTVAGEGSGGNVFINTSNVLPENPKIISDTFGSLWRDSIVKTSRGVYGVDTIGKKIWRTNGETFECISDFRVQEFLNQLISLTERELEPIIGIRNVKTHYNKFKGDVMFTFYDNLHGFEEKVWNLCWNENLLKWITFYSWVPSYSENIYNQYFSFDRNTSKWITKLGVSKNSNDFSDGITLKNNVITDEEDWSTTLHLSNRNIPTGNDIQVNVEYEIVRDNYGNYKLFNDPEKTNLIDKETKLPIWKISLKKDVKYEDLCSEYYIRGKQSSDGTWSELITFDNNIPLIYKLGEWKHDLENKTYIVFGTKYDSTQYLIKDGNLILNSGSVYSSSEYEIKADNSAIVFNRNLEYTRTLGLVKNGELIILSDKDRWIKNCIKSSEYSIYKDERGRRKNLLTKDVDKRINGDRIVILLNIRAKLSVSYTGLSSLGEAYASGYTDKTFVDAGYYESVVALIPKYNMLFLTTDFWKHGLAGIIDIADKIYPTYWYGKQHPFEFEFVVADNPDKHKIFDNLEIISNKATPESFHYEIVGECYDFAKDKKNMYIRQEATKELYQFNGSDIVFNSDYKDLISEHRPLTPGDPNPLHYDKSTIFPLYYSRQDTINEIEDFYHLYGHKDNYGRSDKNFSALAGAEIVRYENLDEYRIWNHAKAVDIKEHGLLRGNMYYKEDKWYAQINPINLVLRNEAQKEWDRNEKSNPPIVYNLFPLPKDISNITSMRVPETLSGFLVTNWNNMTTDNKEAKVKDKFVKIRIRYSGEDLAIISAIRTLYSISYG